MYNPDDTLTIKWETFNGPLPSMCNSAKDLATLTSPFRGSITNMANLHTLSCGSQGNEAAFFYKLPPGYTISIAQIDNNFDSKHELRVGDSCPGNRSLACEDDPDHTTLTYSNEKGREAVTVTFIIDSYDGKTGDFTLSWNITNDAKLQTMCEEGVDLARLSSPYQSTARTLYRNTKLSCGDHGNAELFRYRLPPLMGLAIAQTSESFESFRELRVGRSCPGESVSCQEGAATSYMSYYNAGNNPKVVSFLLNAISTSAAQPYSLSWRVERLWQPMTAKGFTCDDYRVMRGAEDQFACQILAMNYKAAFYSFRPSRPEDNKESGCTVSRQCKKLKQRANKTWQTYSAVVQYHKTTQAWQVDWGVHRGMSTGGKCTSDAASAYVQCCDGPGNRQRALRPDCSVGMVQYKEAMAVCANKGGTICSMAAIKKGLKGRSVCGFDASTVLWTSESCKAPPLGLLNGGFEQYTETTCGRDTNNAFCTVTSETLPAWEVTGTVLRVRSEIKAWRQAVKSMEGLWFIALFGTGYGSVSTVTKDLKRGNKYLLSWYERTRPGFPMKTLQVSVQDQVVVRRPASLAWTRFEVEFTAKSDADSIKFEDQGQTSGAILLDDVRVLPASNSEVFWIVDNTEGGRSCDKVCAGMGSECVSAAITSLQSQSRDAISKAFTKAMGWRCMRYRDDCSRGSSCVSLGSPYLKTDSIGDKTCYGGSTPGLATCGQKPENANHRRLCPCKGRVDCSTATCQKSCSVLLSKLAAKDVVDTCAGCSARSRCYPGADGWPVLKSGGRGREKPNRFPPENHYCPDCKPCQCRGSGYGFESCGEMCCPQSPWSPDSKQQCWEACPNGASSSKNGTACEDLCANVKCSSHSLPCSQGKCKCKDNYQGLYCDIAPGTSFTAKIGRSDFVSKTISVKGFEDITCNSVVDKRNWAGSDKKGPHVFEVSVHGQAITVIRTDTASGWDIKLRFMCTGKPTTSTSTPWQRDQCAGTTLKCQLDMLGRVSMRPGPDFSLCCSHPGQHLCPGEKCCMGTNCDSGVCRDTVTGMELGSGNPGDGVCQSGKQAITWIQGEGSCTDVCAEKEMACSEYALTTLTRRDSAAVVAKAAGITCSSWIEQRDYGMGFSQCKGKACCQGQCDGSCFLSQPQRCDVFARQFGHQRICPCQDLGVTDGWLLVLSSDLGSGGGDFAKPGYGYPSANFKTHLTGQELFNAGFDMLQIVLLSTPRQSRIFRGRYDLRQLDRTCTGCNCPGNHLGGGLYWHGGGGKCYQGAHFGLATTTDVHAKCSGSNPSWWGHFHREGINTGVRVHLCVNVIIKVVLTLLCW